MSGECELDATEWRDVCEYVGWENHMGQIKWCLFLSVSWRDIEQGSGRWWRKLTEAGGGNFSIL